MHDAHRAALLPAHNNPKPVNSARTPEIREKPVPAPACLRGRWPDLDKRRSDRLMTALGVLQHYPACQSPPGVKRTDPDQPVPARTQPQRPGKTGKQGPGGSPNRGSNPIPAPANPINAASGPEIREKPVPTPVRLGRWPDLDKRLYQPPRALPGGSATLSQTPNPRNSALPTKAHRTLSGPRPSNGPYPSPRKTPGLRHTNPGHTPNPDG